MTSGSVDSAAAVVRLVRERIASGHYAAHSLLPSQRQLAEELGVGRAYVRKALAELSRAGLLRSHQGTGTQVLPARAVPAAPTLAFVHSPISGWISHEGSYLAAGIADRLRALGYAYDRYACGQPAEAAGPAVAAAKQ